MTSLTSLSRTCRSSVFCLLTALLLGGGCDGSRASPDGEQAKETAAPEVEVMLVQPGQAVFTYRTTGRTAPSLLAEVRPQVSGIIKERLFVEGSNVTKGETLYLIEDDIYRAAHESAKAAVAKAETGLNLAGVNLNRFKTLLASKSVSRQDYDDADAAYRSALAEYHNQKALLEETRIRYEYTRITAPISGRIGASNVTVGALVTEHQGDMLTSIQQINPIYVKLALPATELARIRRMTADGLMEQDSFGKVRILLADDMPYPQEGDIDFSDITVDSGTGMVTLRATFSNPDSVLLPNMSVRTELTEGRTEQAVLLPQRAVNLNPDGSASVYILGPENIAEARAVTLGATMGKNWHVTAGLEQGDRVIVEGLRNVRPGVKVNPVAMREGIL